MGDEGKGKIVDLLTGTSARWCASGRPQRRPHPGDRRQEDRAALIPSGILRDDALCLIGNGVVCTRRVAQGNRRAGRQRRGSALAPQDQPGDAADHALPHRPGPGAREAAASRRSAPPAAASARPTRTRWRAAASAWPTCITRNELADKLRAALDYHNFVLTQYLKVDAVDFQQTWTRRWRSANTSSR